MSSGASPPWHHRGMAETSQRAQLTVRDNSEEHRFEAVDESGVVAGFAAYRRSDEAVTFIHTVVDDAFEGHGVGSTLVEAALDMVRDEGLRVVPRCPFVASYIERHPAYADLVD
ncbi:MAG TPA: GNAT family N-acetyltransferase [Nocardioidaceae bacterium]|nr:GNAT family N-acetyltransferase [Nocardioidaceae bacterium]